MSSLPSNALATVVLSSSPGEINDKSSSSGISNDDTKKRRISAAADDHDDENTNTISSRSSSKKRQARREENDDNDDDEVVIVIPKAEEQKIRSILLDKLSRNTNNNENMLYHGLRQLADMCRTRSTPHAFPNHQMIVEDLGGLIIVLCLMRQHDKHVGIQWQGCRVMANGMCFTESTKDAVMRLGGVKVIVQAMLNFKEDMELNRCALACIMNLLTSSTRTIKNNSTTNNNNNSNNAHARANNNSCSVPYEARAAQLVKDKTVIEVIIQAMRQFPDHVELLSFALCSLARLCKLGYLDQIDQAHGYSAIVAAFEKHQATSKLIRTNAKITMKLLDKYVQDMV